MFYDIRTISLLSYGFRDEKDYVLASRSERFQQFSVLMQKKNNPDV